MNEEQKMEKFALIERIIIEALYEAEDEIGQETDLRLLMAVLAKITADASVDYGFDEEQFVSSMRSTYRKVVEMKADTEGEMQ